MEQQPVAATIPRNKQPGMTSDFSGDYSRSSPTHADVVCSCALVLA